MICHWVKLIAGEKAGPDGFRRAMQCLAAIFYADDGILNSPRMARLHEAMGALTGMFGRVGIYTNVKTNVSDGMSALLHVWRSLGGGISEKDDGGG